MGIGPNQEYTRARDRVIPDGEGYFADKNHDHLGPIQYPGTPTVGAKKFAKGCLWIDTANGELYINKGTSASATWKKVTTAE